MIKVIIMNWPAEVGKDTTAEMLKDMIPGSCIRMVKTEIYKATAEYYKIPLDLVIELCTNRKFKDEPNENFRGKTPRQGLIYVSDDVMKVQHGDDYFGIKLIESFPEHGVVIVPDGGFYPEIAVIVEDANMDEEVLILQATRTGRTEWKAYDKCGKVVGDDSRNWIDADALQYSPKPNRFIASSVLRFHNNGSKYEPALFILNHLLTTTPESCKALLGLDTLITPLEDIFPNIHPLQIPFTELDQDDWDVINEGNTHD